MAETPNHMAGKDMGCGFIGAIFGPKPQKTSSVSRLEASKEHRKPHFRVNHTSKRPPQTTSTQILYSGYSKPVHKHPPSLLKPNTKTLPTVVKKPDNTKYNSPSKGALYSVSQITNVSYTKQLRKEPCFTSSELSLGTSVRGTPNSIGSMYRASSNHVLVPEHLGNLMKKKPDIRKNYDGKLGNIYGKISVNKPGHEAFKNMGNEKYKQGRFDEAVALYTEAIGINSSIASYYSNRSAALIGLGKLIDAILDCKVAIRIDPSYHRAHYRLASLYLRFGEADKALSHYKCSGEKAERPDIAKVQAVKAQIVACLEARKVKDWKRLLKESRFAFSLGADSSPLVLTQLDHTTISR